MTVWKWKIESFQKMRNNKLIHKLISTNRQKYGRSKSLYQKRLSPTFIVYINVYSYVAYVAYIIYMLKPNCDVLLRLFWFERGFSVLLLLLLHWTKKRQKRILSFEAPRFASINYISPMMVIDIHHTNSIIKWNVKYKRHRS